MVIWSRQVKKTDKLPFIIFVHATLNIIALKQLADNYICCAYTWTVALPIVLFIMHIGLGFEFMYGIWRSWQYVLLHVNWTRSTVFQNALLTMLTHVQYHHPWIMGQQMANQLLASNWKMIYNKADIKTSLFRYLISVKQKLWDTWSFRVSDCLRTTVMLRRGSSLE